MVTNSDATRITAGTLVSGLFGDLYLPDGAKRRKRHRIYGVIICSVGENKYKVRFDFRGGIELELKSNKLKI